MKQFLLLLSSTAIMVSSFMGCDKDDDPQMNEPMVSFRFDYKVGSEDFFPGQTYTINGTTVKFETANFYVGGIRLMSMDGDMVSAMDKYLLVKPTSGAQDVMATDLGHLHMAVFHIGVDSINNNQTEQDYTNRPADDPLAEQIPSMHWSWNSGYRFVRIDGEVDTDGDGEVDSPLAFHLGNDDRLTEINLTVHRDLEGENTVVPFEFDLATLFKDIDLSVDHTFHTTPEQGDLADQFVTNLRGAIRLP